MKTNIYKTEEALLTAFAKYFIEIAQKYISKNGVFNLVLAGGTSPKKLYELLASPLFKDKIEWEKLFFFFGDERCVPADDDANNGLMVQKLFFSPLKISSTKIFKIDTSVGPSEAAAKYSEQIKNHFQRNLPSFDLIILGLGENSHTASLFPYNEVLTEKNSIVKEVYLENENRHRITMTAPLINKAKNVAFLVYGESKRKAIYNVLKGEQNIEKYPAQLIQLENGETQWFLDVESAALL